MAENSALMMHLIMPSYTPHIVAQIPPILQFNKTKINVLIAILSLGHLDLTR